MAKFCWVDLEMTGLDEKTDHILEVAVVITDENLKPLEDYAQVVFQPPEIVSAMNDWCKKTHGASGLTAAIPGGKGVEVVEKELIALLDRHFKKEERVVIAGNSIGNDRRFIDRYWPNLAKRLHYRMVDVSSFKEVYRERFDLEFKKDRNNQHRAVQDILQSIKELEYYLSFVTPPPKEA